MVNHLPLHRNRHRLPPLPLAAFQERSRQIDCVTGQLSPGHINICRVIDAFLTMPFLYNPEDTDFIVGEHSASWTQSVPKIGSEPEIRIPSGTLSATIQGIRHLRHYAITSALEAHSRNRRATFSRGQARPLLIDATQPTSHQESSADFRMLDLPSSRPISVQSRAVPVDDIRTLLEASRAVSQEEYRREVISLLSQPGGVPLGERQPVRHQASVPAERLRVLRERELLRTEEALQLLQGRQIRPVRLIRQALRAPPEDEDDGEGSDNGIAGVAGDGRGDELERSVWRE